MRKKETLRRKVLGVLIEQGFTINPHLKVKGTSKLTLRRVQRRARLEQISFHEKFLRRFAALARTHCRDGEQVDPEKIQLEIREVKADSEEEILFRWWNFMWWSIPYQHPFGRQMRFLLWDVTHESPFGLICLQSPVLKMAVRDAALGIPSGELDVWVNKSMSAQRVGALPPYNQLLGGKMVALALTATEIREAYVAKYKNYVTLIKQRKLPADLLFITTTSAFGRSSLYNRLRYRGEHVAECIGSTQGSGSFHIPEDLYQQLLEFLARKGIDVARGYGHGPSRKLKLISLALKYLGLPKFEYHGIKREFYLFPLARNLREVIRQKERPVYVSRSFQELAEYWKERWAIPRAERLHKWREFKASRFFASVTRTLNSLDGI